jgi:hypothetical protein
MISSDASDKRHRPWLAHGAQQLELSERLEAGGPFGALGLIRAESGTPGSERTNPEGPFAPFNAPRSSA